MVSNSPAQRTEAVQARSAAISVPLEPVKTTVGFGADSFTKVTVPNTRGNHHTSATILADTTLCSNMWHPALVRLALAAERPLSHLQPIPRVPKLLYAVRSDLRYPRVLDHSRGRSLLRRQHWMLQPKRQQEQPSIRYH
jgi:hypothetical protein